MKTAILTFTYGDNYGQRLQNLAVQEMLRIYSEEVYTIHQIPYIKPFKRRIKDYWKKLRKGDTHVLRERHKSFLEFDSNYIRYFNQPISEKTMHSFPQDDFDFFVCGSDQIWSPFSPDVNATMFLTFAERHKRIALSPSIAAESIPNDQVEKYKKYFNGFDFLSVREERGASIIREICGREAEVLIDPTLMHDRKFWEKYIKEPLKKTQRSYASCYFLGEPYEGRKIDEICKEYNLERIDLMNQNQYRVMGPCEFLYMIRNASIVITDSYHGCIFSILFHVPFIMCERMGTKLDMNSRFSTLFGKLNIQGRQLQEITIREVFSMDYSSIDSNINWEREKAKKYLDTVFARN